MLARKPCSGYELKQRLEVFWQAKHSQIYPLLTKLEQEEILTYIQVAQTGKPDKKIYSLTEKGLKILQQWIPESPAEPVIRDEFLTKAYSIWLADAGTAERLLRERIATYEEKVASREGEIKKMEQEYGEDVQNSTSRHFGRYILFQRALKQYKEEVDWCRWVMSMLEKRASL
jgi:PadR family transcriptional regulator, regulatory protein AphA